MIRELVVMVSGIGAIILMWMAMGPIIEGDLYTFFSEEINDPSGQEMQVINWNIRAMKIGLLLSIAALIAFALLAPLRREPDTQLRDRGGFF